ncbi:MAG TPA: hypothetical protein DDY18_08305 [Flavobacterium sp.]|jgi:hypothetical protein|nr:hypothetical protein [Flavobacterium sp.]
MANMWDKEESVSEYQLMAEDAQQAEELAEQYASSPGLVEANEEVLEEISDEAAFELTNTESNVIYNARLRLEQAKLYELLINHNLFEGVDASPQAIKNVQNELKFYIVKRLEILLGLREPTAAKVNTAPAESQFNDVEVEFLKQLAYKGTLGKSIGQPIVANPQQVVKPLTSTPSSGLKPLAKIKKTEPPTEVKQTVEQPPTKPVQKKVVVQPQQKTQAAPPSQPKPQPKKTVKVRPSGLGRDLTQDEIMAIAQEDLKTASNKPFHEMTPKEKAERIRQANERNARNKAPVAKMPMPSAAELEMKYATQQQSGSMSKSSTDQFNVAIAQAIAAKKNRGDDNE